METESAKCHWYLPTPARLVWGAAVAAGVLYVCERWRWFPVNYQKGWPVLLAAAVVAAVLMLLPAWMLMALVLRRRMQFGLRTLLLFVTLCAIVCSWMTVRVREARRQAEAVAAIEKKLGAFVFYDWEMPYLHERAVPPSPKPVPLKELFGLDFFADVEAVAIYPVEATDADFANLAVLTRLNDLQLDGDEVTDARLSHIEDLTQLRNLELHKTKVTDESVKKLQSALPDCEILVNKDRRW